MTTYKTLALVFWVGCLTACNESDSNDIDTSRIILDAVLTANDDNVNMRVDLRKEGSDSIKLVLNGGDYLKANADTQTKVMEYQSDIFKNSYYRASFSLNLASRLMISAALVRCACAISMDIIAELWKMGGVAHHHCWN